MNTLFALFGSLIDGGRAADINLQEMSDYIKNDRQLESWTLKAREYLERGDKTGYNEIKKKNIRAITPNAYFSYGRQKGSDHQFTTGVIMYDYDHLTPEQMEILDDRLRLHPSTVFYGKSLSGKGVHEIIRVNGVTDENFKISYKNIGEELEWMTGIPYDPNCNKVEQMMLFAYDPGCYVNSDALAIDMTKIEGLDQVFKEPNMDTSAVGLAQRINASKPFLDMNEGNRHSSLFRLICRLNREGYEEKAVADILVENFAQPDFNEQEIRVQIVEDIYKRYRAEHGIRKKSQSLKVSVGTILDEDEVTDEVIPDAIAVDETWVMHMPRVIADGIHTDYPNEYQYVYVSSFEVSCTNMMTEVHYITHEAKDARPCLSLAIVGPSTTGKGGMKEAVDFFREFDNYYTQIREREIKEAKAKHKAWEAQQKKKEKNPDLYLEPEPEIPLPCQFLIGNISDVAAQKMQKGNDGRPFLFSTSELASWNTYNKSSNGSLSALLRKMTSNEWAGTTSCMNGRNDAVLFGGFLVSGTWMQTKIFLDNSEDGLVNRCEYVLTKRISPLHDGSNIDDTDFAKFRERDTQKAKELQKLYLFLSTLKANVHFPPAIRKKIGQVIAQKREAVRILGKPSYMAYITRSFEKIYSLCVLYTVFGMYGNEECYIQDTEGYYELEVTETIADMILRRFDYMCACASCVIDHLPAHSVPTDKSSRKMADVWEKIKGCDFTSKSLMEEYNIPKATTFRYISSWISTGAIVQVKAGHYHKTNCSDTTYTYSKN